MVGGGSWGWVVHGGLMDGGRCFRLMVVASVASVASVGSVGGGSYDIGGCEHALVSSLVYRFARQHERRDPFRINVVQVSVWVGLDQPLEHLQIPRRCPRPRRGLDMGPPSTPGV